MKKNLLLSSILLLNLLFLSSLVSCNSAKAVKEDKMEKEAKMSLPNSSKPSADNTNKILVYLGGESVTKWRLVTLNDQNAGDLYTILPVMRFDETWKQIYGLTSCNKFTAYYTRDNQAFSITRLSSTEKLCAVDESLFLDSLQGVDEVSEEGNTISFSTNGKVVLVFEKF